MSSFLFDSNALVYWTYPSAPQHAEVSHLISRTVEEDGRIYALSSCLNEIYHALHTHYMAESDARESIRDISEVFDLVDLTAPLVADALDSDEPDYEDGLVRAAAEALQVDFIITYDKKAFADSFVPKATAAQALSLMDATQQKPSGK